MTRFVVTGFCLAATIAASADDAAAQPVVQIQVDNSYARELNEVAATLEFVASEPAPAGGLVLDVEVSGSATPDVDYVALTLPFVMAEGESTINVRIEPFDDGVFEDEEKIILTLLESDAYTLGEVALATIFLQDSGRVFDVDAGNSDAGSTDAGTSDAGVDDVSPDAVSTDTSGDDVTADADLDDIAADTTDTPQDPDVASDVDDQQTPDAADDSDTEGTDVGGALDDASPDVGPDAINPDADTSGEPVESQPAGGCNASPAPPSSSAFIVGLALLALRRRRSV